MKNWFDLLLRWFVILVLLLRLKTEELWVEEFVIDQISHPSFSNNTSSSNSLKNGCFDRGELRRQQVLGGLNSSSLTSHCSKRFCDKNLQVSSSKSVKCNILKKPSFEVEKRVEFSNGSHTTSAELGRNRDKCPFVTLASRVKWSFAEGRRRSEWSQVLC